MLAVIVAVLAALTIPGDMHSANAAGIPAVLLSIPSSPLVTFRIQFRAGAADDPDGKKGLTQLTASMMTEGGTVKHSYEEITSLLYPMAASVNDVVDKDVTTFVGTTHIENLDRYLDLFLQVLLEPRFDARDFERVKTSQSSYLSNTLRGGNDEELGKETLGMFMYAGHPYGAPNAGLVSNLDAITLDDVKAHYAKMFTRANVTIGLAGGYPKELPGKISKALEKLPATTPSHPARPEDAADCQCRSLPGGERHAFDRDLDGIPHRRHAQRSRFLRVDGGQFASWRAPHHERRAHEPHARSARAQLWRLFVHRALRAGRRHHVSADQLPAQRAILLDLESVPCSPSTATSPCASRSSSSTGWCGTV